MKISGCNVVICIGNIVVSNWEKLMSHIRKVTNWKSLETLTQTLLHVNVSWSFFNFHN